MNKIDLFEIVARSVGDLVLKDTPSAVTGTTIDANGLVHPISGQLKGYHIFFPTVGAQDRVITDFTPASNRITVGEALSPVPSTNSDFFVYRNFSGEDYVGAYDAAFNTLYFHRNPILDQWEQVHDQYDKMQALWVAEKDDDQAAWADEKKEDMDAFTSTKISEQSTWHANKLVEQTVWAAIQAGWKSSLDDVWTFTHRMPVGFPAMLSTLATLSMVTPGSLSVGTVPIGTIPIGTLPIGTLLVPSLPLASIPTESSIGSYGDTVPDDPILVSAMAAKICQPKILEGEREWGQKFATFQVNIDSSREADNKALQVLIDSIASTWKAHKENFEVTSNTHKQTYELTINAHRQYIESTLNTHKQRYDQDWTQFKQTYEVYKAGVETRWQQLLGIIGISR